MNHVDIFTGIAGFSIAAEWVWGKEHNIILFCENDKYCQKRLRQLWPNVPIIEDITKLNGREITEAINLLTFGWPCQPYSVAGKQKGKEDDRYIWPEAYRVIQETNPTWILGENVTGIINMELDDVLSDLESIGYETQTFNIPACSVDARHRRERIWIVGRNTNSGRCSRDRGKEREIQEEITDTSGAREDVANSPEQNDRRDPSESMQGQIQQFGECDKPSDVSNTESGRTGGIRNESKEKRPQNSNELSGKCGPNVSDTEEERSQGLGTSGQQITEAYGRKKLSMCDSSDRAIWPVEPDVGRVAHGIPNRAHRLKALGNAIVPQVVVVIMRGIKEIELDR